MVGCNEYKMCRHVCLYGIFCLLLICGDGDGYIAPTPKEAGERASNFYTDNALANAAH